jgi:hypothetical protein
VGSSNNRCRSGSANGTESGDIEANEGSMVIGAVLLTSGGVLLANSQHKAIYSEHL